MNYLTLRELQLKELEIAKDIDGFCNKYNISYFLSSGSLLGAIRHKGFIPWDDDMDMYMPRKDYDLFCNSYRSDKYYVKFCENGSLHAPFAKVCNPRIKVVCDNLYDTDNSELWVDIFPIDGLPSNKFLRSLEFFYIKNLNRLLMLSRSPKGSKGKFGALIRTIVYKTITNKPRILSCIAKRISKISRRVPTFSTGLCANTTYHLIYASSLFDERDLYIFEDTVFYSFRDYDNYLKLMYGNYMELPPENKRGGHYMKAYCLDDNSENM